MSNNNNNNNNNNHHHLPQNYPSRLKCQSHSRYSPLKTLYSYTPNQPISLFEPSIPIILALSPKTHPSSCSFRYFHVHVILLYRFQNPARLTPFTYILPRYLLPIIHTLSSKLSLFLFLVIFVYTSSYSTAFKLCLTNTLNLPTTSLQWTSPLAIPSP